MFAAIQITTLRERALQAKEENEREQKAVLQSQLERKREEKERELRHKLEKKLGLTEGIVITFSESGQAYAEVDGMEFYVWRDEYGSDLKLLKPCGVEGCTSKLGVSVHSLASLGYALDDDTVPTHEHYFPDKEEGEAKAEVIARPLTTGERLLAALEDYLNERQV